MKFEENFNRPTKVSSMYKIHWDGQATRPMLLQGRDEYSVGLCKAIGCGVAWNCETAKSKNRISQDACPVAGVRRTNSSESLVY